MVKQDNAKWSSLLDSATADFSAGRLESALANVGRAVQLKSDDGQALLLLGIVQLELGRPAAAIPPLRKALRLRPDDAMACFALSAALAAAAQSSTQFADALTLARKAALAGAKAAGLSDFTPTPGAN